MGQLLVPAMIGAGVGAVGGAVTGRSPFKSALLGGALGGLGSAGGLFGSGSGLLSGLKGVATTPVSLGTGGYASGIGGQIIPEVVASAAPIASTASTVPFGSTEFISPYTKEGIVNFADGTTSTLAPDYLSAGVNYGANAPNFTPVLGKSADYVAGGYGGGGLFGNISDMFGGLSTSDKLGLGLKGFDLMNQPQQMIQPVQVAPITRGNPEAVSTPLFNVAPTITSQENAIGLPNLKTTIPLTDEEKLRLQQLAQYGYRG